ncbi:MAG: nucleotidyltransferase [Candidatus Omnitrophica bacterium]|nr:nucleotidyltransferase [Candidatus Omnitrophota bacterium]
MKVTETDLANFIDDKVALSEEKANAYRKQVNNLREKLEGYIKDHPDFELVKMLNSGSVAKGTALSLINDMDVAVYVRPDKLSSQEVKGVLEYVRQALIKVYSGLMTPDQFTLGTHCVRVSFKGSGLDVEVVPVIPNGKADDRGNVLNRDTGAWVETSIPLHLSFIRERKDLYPLYADLVRLTKWWRVKRDFKFKSFLIELLWCHLVDAQTLPSSRVEAFAKFLSYLLRTRLEEKIIFTDHYSLSDVQDNSLAPVKVYDPVNPKNNVASNMTQRDKAKIIEETQAAFDAVSMAASAYTKEKAVEYWQRVLGTAFNP